MRCINVQSVKRGHWSVEPFALASGYHWCQSIVTDPEILLQAAIPVSLAH